MASEITSYPALNSIKNAALVELMLRYLLPGGGKKTKEICNTVTSADYCPHCHKTIARYYHCKNFLCPECYHAAAYQAAVRAADYLTGCKKAWAAFYRDVGYTNHIEFSVPKELYENFDKEKMFRQAINYAKDIGISGGGMVFHAFRIKEQYQRPIQQAVSASGRKMGSWDAIKEDILGLGSVAEYIYFSPHFHCVGFFKMKMKSSKYYELTGWTYTNITRKHKRGQEQQEDIKKIYAYLLTHHAHQPGKQAIHYFGVASKNKLERETWKEKEYRKCSCGEQMYLISVWSEKRIKEIEEGSFIIKPDDYLKKSVIITIHNRYRVRSSQATIQTQYEKDSPGGLVCP